MEKDKTVQKPIFQLESDSHLTRLAANFFQQNTNGEYAANDVETVKKFFYYALNSQPLKKYKVALCFICVNENYWEFIPKTIEGAKKFFLPNHEVDYFVWSDLPKEETDKYEATIFPTESVEWPLPTLFRYHLFLQQEETLKKYDYVFYCDIDMVFASYVGDEVLGEGITAALHPMYALRSNFVAPFEPNPESAAYIPFDNNYYAGGFQGGKAGDFIKAMKEMKKTIDTDFENKNYIARWNDESHWNKYLKKNPPSIVLSPAYIYPDSLINEYYIKIWGRNYSPKLVTLTKKFTVNSAGGAAIQEQLKTL